MRITWLGHASFLLETAGKRIITDPFEDTVGYPLYQEAVEVVTISHNHYDHNAAHLLQGDPVVIREPGHFKADGIDIQGIESFHDKKQGRERGKNNIYLIRSEDLMVAHLGDLGHMLTAVQLEQLKDVDILLIPVGGRYTVDANDAYEIVRALHPRITIPMHFKTPHCTINLASVEDFTARFPRVVKLPFLQVSRSDLDEKCPIIVLDYLAG